MSGHIGVVTFLNNEGEFEFIDPWFRKLVQCFHQIPFSATFGVSCSGHFFENKVKFNPKPWGNLTIIVLPNVYHIKELLIIIRQVVKRYPDATFKKIKHIFGPPGSVPFSNNKICKLLELYTIRVGDNDCLHPLEFSKNYCGGDLLIQNDTNIYIYNNSKKRCEEIKEFWGTLEKEVYDFCNKYKFVNFALKERIEEIINVWRLEVEINNKLGLT